MMLMRVLITVLLFSILYGCQMRSSLMNGHSFRVDRFCDLMNTNDDLDCLDYVTDNTSIVVDISKSGMSFRGMISDSDIQNSLTERDDLLYKESCFEIFFDIGADGKDYYEIEINPTGAIFDYMLRDAEGPLNTDENMVQWHIPQENLTVEVMGTINDSSDQDVGWSFTLDVPWNLLYEETPKMGQSCIAFNFMRVDADGDYKPRYWVYKPTGKKLIHVPEAWPKVNC